MGIFRKAAEKAAEKAGGNRVADALEAAASRGTRRSALPESACGTACEKCGTGQCTRDWHGAITEHSSSSRLGGCGHHW